MNSLLQNLQQMHAPLSSSLAINLHLTVIGKHRHATCRKSSSADDNTKNGQQLHIFCEISDACDG